LTGRSIRRTPDGERSASDRISDYGLVLLGVLSIASPWGMGFDNIDNMALTAWVAGAVTLVFGILALPGIDKRMHRTPIAHWEPL
jgi:hypothetical protein